MQSVIAQLSGLPLWEAPIMIPDKRKLLFSFFTAELQPDNGGSPSSCPAWAASWTVSGSHLVLLYFS